MQTSNIDGFSQALRLQNKRIQQSGSRGFQRRINRRRCRQKRGRRSGSPLLPRHPLQNQPRDAVAFRTADEAGVFQRPAKKESKQASARIEERIATHRVKWLTAFRLVMSSYRLFRDASKFGWNGRANHPSSHPLSLSLSVFMVPTSLPHPAFLSCAVRHMSSVTRAQSFRGKDCRQLLVRTHRDIFTGEDRQTPPGDTRRGDKGGVARR